MARAPETRDDRIERRTTKEEKRLLVAAAAQERLDVTSFIMRSALPKARDVIARAERIALSGRDTVRVLELLENPPPPPKRLLDTAHAKYGAARSTRRAGRAGRRSRKDPP